MKRTAILFSLLCFVPAIAAHAQASESATARQFSITAGGTVSAFRPGIGNNIYWSTNSNYLAGVGTYVDFHFTHWVQLEGEARWLRFHEYRSEHQDNYLLGPKVPVFRFGSAEAYGKALVGVGKMTFPKPIGYGTFTALAFGGGVDYRLSKKVTVRGDFEFQDWPSFLPGATLRPWGLTAGMAYRVF